MNAEAEVRRQKEREREKKGGEIGGAFVFYLFMKSFSIIIYLLRPCRM